MKPEVRLTYKEMMEAGHVGLMRMVENIKEGRKETHGVTTDASAWGRHVEAAMAELAFCKHYGFYWGGLGSLNAPDVYGTNIEIRWTHWPNGKLVVQANNKDDHIYWLLTGRFGKYIIHGYMLGADAKQDQWWPGPNPEQHKAFFVPQSELTEPRESEGYGYKS